MTKSERMDKSYISYSTEAQICINCKHWVRHYIPGGGIYTVDIVPLEVGHCMTRRFKYRKAYDSCENFSRKDGKENDDD